MNHTENTAKQNQNFSSSKAEILIGQELQSLIEQSKIISFDVFDTLLVRPVHNPSDVFLLMERQTGVTGFHDARMHAEFVAREKLFQKTDSHEVNLDEIYRCLRLPKKQKDWSIAELMILEMETELNLLTRSAIISPIYEMAINSGKLVIAVSDMYLPASLITEALERNGMPVDRIFVSSQYRISKHEGTLYGEVCSQLGVKPHQVLHFGDNFTADCESALKAGVVGYHIPSMRDQLSRDTRYNQNAINRMVNVCHGLPGEEKNLMASIMLAHLAQFKAKHGSAPMAAVMGAMYAGPLVSGFAYWLDVMMKVDDVRHLRLVTRDGYVTKEIWDRLGLSGDVSILHSSRRLTLVPALVDNFKIEVQSLLSTSTTTTLRECINRLSLSDDGELLEALSRLTSLDRPVNSPRKVEEALRALRSCEEILKRIANEELSGYINYLINEDFDQDKDAIADCGWALSSQKRMEGFLGQKIRGYYIGTLSHAHMHDGIKSFLFHKGDYAGWVEIAERAVELLELPFATSISQICRFTANGEGIVMEQEPQHEIIRSIFIKRMHQETASFADFLRPMMKQITLEEFRDVLFMLFDALVNYPTSFEYHELAGLPHNREYGKSEVATIGTFWRLRGEVGYVSKSGKSLWKDYMRIGYISLRQAGPKTTWIRAKRVLRRKIRGE